MFLTYRSCIISHYEFNDFIWLTTTLYISMVKTKIIFYWHRLLRRLVFVIRVFCFFQKLSPTNSLFITMFFLMILINFYSMLLH
uniref:Uncharacterized protein n=1 Tax=Arundo donax TaxID=35708 RepID=A0A0A9BNP0_ARUDO